MAVSQFPDTTNNYVIATSTTLPSGGYEGQMAWASDTDTLYLHDGTAWQIMSPRIPHTSSVNVAVASASSTTSSSMVNLVNRCRIVGFVKHRNDTNLVIHVDSSVFNDQALGSWEIGYRVNANTAVLCQGGYANYAYGFTTTDAVGYAAGTYDIEMVKRRGNAAGNVFDGQNGVSFNSITVTETYA